MSAAKALARLLKCAGSSEPWLLADHSDVLRTRIPFMVVSIMIDQIFLSTPSQNKWIFFSSMTFDFTILNELPVVPE